MYNHYFSTFGSPPVPEDICKDSAKRHAWFWRRRFLKVFPYKCIGKQTWSCRKKGQTSTYDNSFSNVGRPPVPDDSRKGSAPRYSRFWRRRFLKVFTIYGRGGHLGQRTATILAIFRSPHPKKAPYEIWAKLAQRLQRRSCLKFWTFFPYKCIRKKNWPYGKKVKCQCTTIILAILVALLFPKIYAKIQP